MIPQQYQNYFGYLFPLLIFLVLRFIFDFNGLYGQDSHEYLRYSKVLHEYFLGGAAPGDFAYPIGMLYAVYGSIIAFIVPQIWAMQLLSIGSLLLTLFYFQKILAFLFPKSTDNTSIYTFLCFTMSPYVLRYSMMSMTDMFCLCFTVMSFYYALKYWENSHFSAFCLTVFCAASAFMVRYVAAVVLIIPALITLVKVLKNKQWSLILLALGATTVAFLPQLLLRKADFWSFLGDQGITAWSMKHYFQSSFTLDVSQEQYDWPNIIYVFKNFFHPAYLFLGVPFLFFLKKEDFKAFYAKISISIILLYALYVAGIHYQNLRYMLLSFPFVLLLFFPAFNRFTNWLNGYVPPKYYLTLIAILQLLLFSYSIKKFIQTNHYEQDISAEIATYISTQSENTIIYTLGLEGVMRTYTDYKVVSLWGDLIEKTVPISYLLFNEKQSRQNLLDESVWQNFDYLKRQYQLTPIWELDNQFILYKLDKL